MSANTLRAPAGANKKKSIVGRGRSSGSGKTSGKGHKGQKARSGGGVRVGFEGGQMPLYRRVAARGFSNHPFKTEYIVINVSALEKVYSDGEKVSLDTLVSKGLVKKSEILVKILGDGEITKKLEVEIPSVSSSAREKIEKAGGKVVLPGSSEDSAK
jgi:large subunit ribosomal protein L15